MTTKCWFSFRWRIAIDAWYIYEKIAGQSQTSSKNTFLLKKKKKDNIAAHDGVYYL
jgi:hypothetical protein